MNTTMMQDGQVLRGRVQQGPLERAQEGVRETDQEMNWLLQEGPRDDGCEESG